jgi:hypothetical protein
VHILTNMAAFCWLVLLSIELLKEGLKIFIILHIYYGFSVVFLYSNPQSLNFR